MPRRPNPLDPRKAPAQRRSAHTVSAVIEAAARILEQDGFAGYTTNAIAERAGVSIGSLYQYFPGKDAVTVALIERETGLLLAEIDAAKGAPDAEAALRRMIGAAVTHQMRRPALARLLDVEERRLPIGRRNAHVADLVIGALALILPAETTGTALQDVLAIVKGMVDTAGECGETDAGRAGAPGRPRGVRLSRAGGRLTAPAVEKQRRGGVGPAIELVRAHRRSQPHGAALRHRDHHLQELDRREFGARPGRIGAGEQGGDAIDRLARAAFGRDDRRRVGKPRRLGQHHLMKRQRERIERRPQNGARQPRQRLFQPRRHE